jgi:Ca-activated chloride channel homolog
MKSTNFYRRLSALAVTFALALGATGSLSSINGQSRRQPPVSNQKKNKRPPDAEKKNGQQDEEPIPTDIIGKPQDAETIKVVTQVVNVDAVVFSKKTKQIITGLKKENFAIFEDGEQKEITNFSTPEAPITVAMVIEFSRISEYLGYKGVAGRFDPGIYEVIRPAAMFLSGFVKPPDDYVSVIAFDMRPTPLTDFTNNPARINAVVDLLLKSPPAFTDANLFDALKLTLAGGRADSVVLENRKEAKTEYAGMANLQGRRRALILIASGIDSFSRINYGEARKIVQNAGVPIYIIGTGNYFLKRYGDQIPAQDAIGGTPGRMSLLQAQNTLSTFAKDSGGMYWPVTFEGELPSVLSSINALLRNQYSLGYNPGERREGKQHKLVVKVDVDGDGQYDDKEYVVQSRQYYNEPKDKK